MIVNFGLEPFTPTPTATPRTPTRTPIPTSTLTSSPTRTNTPTITPSRTPTPSLTLTPSDTPTFTPTATYTPTPEPGTISGMVFDDLNGNGVQNTGENGIYGVAISLFDNTGTTFIAGTTADGDGNYSFGGLTAGTYQVVEAVPDGYAGTTPAVVSDVVVTAGNGTVVNFGLEAFTPTPTMTLTSTPTATGTATFTLTPTSTFTATSTASRTPTLTATASRTRTFTPTFTATRTPTATRTSTFTPTFTATRTSTPSRTPTVTPTFTPVPTVVDDGSYLITYQGWFGRNDANASGGGYRYSNIAGQAVAYTTGQPATSVTLVTYTGPDQGEVQIFVDNVSKGTFDLYSPTPKYRQSVTIKNLANTVHAIVVKVAGLKNGASKGTFVWVDAFNVGTAVIEDTDPAVAYGDWAGSLNSNAYGGAYRSSGVSGASVAFTITGGQFRLVTARGAAYGKLDIYKDGVFVGTYDLYNPTQQWQYPLFIKGLGNGTHIIVIQVKGVHSGPSTGNTVVFDAVSYP